MDPLMAQNVAFGSSYIAGKNDFYSQRKMAGLQIAWRDSLDFWQHNPFKR